MSHVLGLDIGIEGLECPECCCDVFEYESDLDRVICVNCATVIYFVEKTFKCLFCGKEIPIEDTKEIQLVRCENCCTNFYVLKV